MNIHQRLIRRPTHGSIRKTIITCDVQFISEYDPWYSVHLIVFTRIEDNIYAREASNTVPIVTIPRKRRLEEIINIIREKIIANPCKTIVRMASIEAIKLSINGVQINSTVIIT
jgi:hypothetical protein